MEPSTAEGVEVMGGGNGAVDRRRRGFAVEVQGNGAEFQKLEVLGSIPGGLVLSSEEGL